MSGKLHSDTAVVDMLLLVSATSHERRYNAVRALTLIPSLCLVITAYGAIRVIQLERATQRVVLSFGACQRNCLTN